MENPPCPGCGAPLELYVGDSQSAPWLCRSNCVRGYWPSELTPEGRAQYDPVARAHQPTVSGTLVRLNAVFESMRAQSRGVNIPEEYVDELDDKQLDALLKQPKIPAEMRDRAQQRRRRRGRAQQRK